MSYLLHDWGHMSVGASASTYRAPEVKIPSNFCSYLNQTKPAVVPQGFLESHHHTGWAPTRICFKWRRDEGDHFSCQIRNGGLACRRLAGVLGSNKFIKDWPGKGNACSSPTLIWFHFNEQSYSAQALFQIFLWRFQETYFAAQCFAFFLLWPHPVATNSPTVTGMFILSLSTQLQIQCMYCQFFTSVFERGLVNLSLYLN